MNDRELLLERLERLAIVLDELMPQCAELVRDAIELLKEQEPTTFKPHYIDKYGKHFICGVECGSCHKEISSTYHYCPWCGRLVKWE